MSAPVARAVDAGMLPLQQTAAPAPVRQRLLDAATRIVARQGWGGVTMARVGHAAGVSRQTVYNEFGSKQGLAEELVAGESALFLDAVRRELAADGPLSEAMGRAAARVFAMARQSPLLLAAVSAAQGAEHELLPLLTTQSETLIDTAAAAVEASIRSRRSATALTDAELRIAVTAVVRLVLSCMMRPSGPPEQMAAQVGWVCSRLIAAAPAQGC